MAPHTRTRMTALMLAAAAVLTNAHDIAPSNDEAFYERHAEVLSESCKAKHGRELLQSEQQTCLLDPETILGPYGWNTVPIRKNITEDQIGIPMTVGVTVVNSTNCEPVEAVAIEIWHCTWDGIYSHYEEQSRGNLSGGTDDTTYLRGIQFTDANGRAEFDTVVPGWYIGRALHIHVRVLFNIEPAADNSGYTGGTSAHVGQLYVPDDWWFDELTPLSPYNENTIGRVPLIGDIVYGLQFGPYGLMEVTKANPDGEWTEGVVAEARLGIYTEERPLVIPIYINDTQAPTIVEGDASSASSEASESSESSPADSDNSSGDSSTTSAATNMGVAATMVAAVLSVAAVIVA